MGHFESVFSRLLLLNSEAGSLKPYDIFLEVACCFHSVFSEESWYFSPLLIKMSLNVGCPLVLARKRFSIWFPGLAPKPSSVVCSQPGLHGSIAFTLGTDHTGMEQLTAFLVQLCNFILQGGKKISCMCNNSEKLPLKDNQCNLPHSAECLCGGFYTEVHTIFCSKKKK